MPAPSFSPLPRTLQGAGHGALLPPPHPDSSFDQRVMDGAAQDDGAQALLEKARLVAAAAADALAARAGAEGKADGDQRAGGAAALGKGLHEALETYFNGQAMQGSRDAEAPGRPATCQAPGQERASGTNQSPGMSSPRPALPVVAAGPGPPGVGGYLLESPPEGLVREQVYGLLHALHQAYARAKVRDCLPAACCLLLARCLPARSDKPEKLARTAGAA